MVNWRFGIGQCYQLSEKDKKNHGLTLIDTDSYSALRFTKYT
jgi:hypothetical protein